MKKIAVGVNGKRKGFALVDNDDYELLMKHSWHFNHGGYVRTAIDGKNILMHVLLMNPQHGEVVDHVNHTPHDNRRGNLEVYTKVSLKNDQNKKKRENTSSKYRGVSYVKAQKKYHSHIMLNYKSYHLGFYKNEVDAAEAFDMFIVHNKHDHIQLNFPNKREEYLKRKCKPPFGRNKTAMYNGVSYNKPNRKYIAQIKVNYKVTYIWSSENPEECAKMYDEYVVKNNIKKKKLNFPHNYPNYDGQKVKTKCENIDSKTVRLILNSRPDANIIIDKKDYDKVKYYGWYISAYGYVVATENNGSYRLHRLIKDQTDPEIFVDHKDGNKLNNVDSNLRISNCVKNGRNKKKNENTKYKYLGISFSKNSFKARIGFNGIGINVGRYDTEEYAARARDIFILRHFPDEHYKMNFDDWDSNTITKWETKLDVKSYDEQIQKYHEELLTAESEDKTNNTKRYSTLLHYLRETRIDATYNFLFPDEI